MSIYQFQATKSSGEQVPLQQYAGKTVLIVNTASKCQFTPQFDELQRIYERYAKEDFVILGFPCNQFAEQEPGTGDEAAAFCRINYGVTFPIFGKLDVNGEEADPLFSFLKQEAPFQGFDMSNIQAKLLKLMISDKNPEWLVGDAIKWNFTKFLINSDGQVVHRYEPTDDMEEIDREIQRLIASKAS
jgi:glutathione peroxidase